MIKKTIILFIILTMCTNAIAVAVSDNDGSAFITKAEFDSLKNDFQSRLDQYNTSINSKIDSAIASYLAGISVSKTQQLNVPSPGRWECVNGQYNASDYTWRYKHGMPMIDVTFHCSGRWAAHSGGGMLSFMSYRGTIPAPTFNENKNLQHKLAITDIDETLKTAKWEGIAYGCTDKIQALTVTWGTFYEPVARTSSGNMYLSYFRPGNDCQKVDSLVGAKIVRVGAGDDSTGWNLGTEFDLVARSLIQDWGTIKNRKVILISKNKKYRNFARYPNQRNWGFYTTDTSDVSSYEKLWQVCNSGGLTMDTQIKDAYGDGSTNGTFNYRFIKGDTEAKEVYDFSDKKTIMPTAFGGGGRTDSYGTLSSHKYCAWPGMGFEDSYIDDWSDLYTTYFDNVVADKVFDTTRSSYFLRGLDGNYHTCLNNGVPICKVPADDAKIKFDIDLDSIAYNVKTGAETVSDPTTSCYVWISDKPFTDYPNNENCLDFTPINNTCEKTTSANFNKAVFIPSSQRGKASIEFTAPQKDNYIWIKWSINGVNGGGAINLPETITSEIDDQNK